MEPNLWELAAQSQAEWLQQSEWASGLELSELQELVLSREKLPNSSLDILNANLGFRKWPVLFHQNQGSTAADTLIALFPCTEELMFRCAKDNCAGVVSSIASFDVFEVQYLLEVARDLRLGFFPIVRTKQELSYLLQTDCPTIVFGDFFEKSNTKILIEVQKIVGTLPKNMAAYCASLGMVTFEEEEILKSLGIRGNFILNF